MMVGIWRSARAKAAMASDFFPGVRAASSSTTRAICTVGREMGQVSSGGFAQQLFTNCAASSSITRAICTVGRTWA